MRLNLIILSLCVALTACGGGGADAPAPAAPVVTTPTVGLPAFVNPTTLTGANINLAMSLNTFLVKTVGGALTIAGDQNIVKIDASSSVGVMQVSGKLNSIIFDVNATVSSLTLTGNLNTVYLPLGSSIVIANAGTMPSLNTVKYYKP